MRSRVDFRGVNVDNIAILVGDDKDDIASISNIGSA
jgi:hypothetical protein